MSATNHDPVTTQDKPLFTQFWGGFGIAPNKDIVRISNDCYFGGVVRERYTAVLAYRIREQVWTLGARKDIWNFSTSSAFKRAFPKRYQTSLHHGGSPIVTRYDMLESLRYIDLYGRCGIADIDLYTLCALIVHTDLNIKDWLATDGSPNIAFVVSGEKSGYPASVWPVVIQKNTARSSWSIDVGNMGSMQAYAHGARVISGNK